VTLNNDTHTIIGIINIGNIYEFLMTIWSNAFNCLLIDVGMCILSSELGGVSEWLE
jgi:hypothetical protein